MISFHWPAMGRTPRAAKFLTEDLLFCHKQTYREWWLLPPLEAPAGVQAVFKPPDREYVPFKPFKSIQTIQKSV